MLSHQVIMSTQLCKLVVLTVRGPGCRVPWRIDPGQVMSTNMGHPGVSQRRAYSLDSLSLVSPGRSSLGRSNQPPRVEGTSASSALTHRNLSALALQVISVCILHPIPLSTTKSWFPEVFHCSCLSRDSVDLCANMTIWISPT